MLPSEFQPQRQAIADALTLAKKQPIQNQALSAALAIVREEQAAGSKLLIVDGAPHLFSALRRRLIPIARNDRYFTSHLAMVYGLNIREQTAGMVAQVLADIVMHHGERRSIRHWVAYQDNALHISNYDGTVWRLTGEGTWYEPDGRLMDDLWKHGADLSNVTAPVGITIEHNGDNVVFADDDDGVPVVDPVVGRNGRLFRFLRSISWSRTTSLQPKDQARAILVWMFAVAFPDVFPTKPLLLLEGDPGSGKTSAIQMIQAMLRGRHTTMAISESGERDFWVSLIRSPIALIDNADEFIKWIPDAVCNYLTGGGREERQLHTNTGRVQIRPNAFLAVASKDPKSFRREDVADRSIVLRMSRRAKSSQEAMIDIFARIQGERAQIYGEWLYYLNRVVAVLAQGKRYPVSHRMADFERFAHAVGEAMNWSPDHVHRLMDSIQRERVEFAAENDIVVEMLERWLEKGQNQDRPMTAALLYKELAADAMMEGKKFVHSPQVLAQRLRAPHVVERFAVATTVDRHKGTKIYRLIPHLKLGDIPVEDKN